MATAANVSQGTQLQVATAGEYRTIAEVTSVGGPSMSRDIHDVTALSVADGFKEFIGDLLDGGEVPFEINFDPDDTTQQDLLTRLTGATPMTMQLAWPNWGGKASIEFTADPDTEVITTAGVYSLVTGQPVKLSTTVLDLPAPLSASRIYFVEVTDTDKLKLYLTSAAACAGAGAVNITDAGTGTHTLLVGHTWGFSAIMAGFEPSSQAGEPLTGTLKLKITGAISFDT